MSVKNFKTSPSTIVPEVGTVMMFAGQISQTNSNGVTLTTAPEGWLLCNGAPYLKNIAPILAENLGFAGTFTSYSSNITASSSIIGIPGGSYENLIQYTVNDSSGFTLGDYVSVSGAIPTELNTDIAEIYEIRSANRIVLAYKTEVSSLWASGGSVSKVDGFSVPNLANRFAISTDSLFSYSTSPRIIGSNSHTHQVDSESFSISNNTTSQDHNHYILSRNPNTQTNAYAYNVSTANYYHDHGGLIAGYSYGSSNTVGQGNGNSQANLISNTHNHSTGSAAYPSPGSYTNVANAAHTHAYYDPANGNAGHHSNSGSSGALTHSHTNVLVIPGELNPFSETTATTESESNSPKNITLNFIIKAG